MRLPVRVLRKFLLQTYLNQYMTTEYELKGITRNTSHLFLRNTFYSLIHDFKTTKVIFMLLLFCNFVYHLLRHDILDLGSLFSFTVIPHTAQTSEWHYWDVEVQGYYGQCQRWTYSTNLLRATSRGRIIFNSVSINTLRRWTPSQSERTRCHFRNN